MLPPTANPEANMAFPLDIPAGVPIAASNNDGTICNRACLIDQQKY
jgi:hypothetical protein